VIDSFLYILNGKNSYKSLMYKKQMSNILILGDNRSYFEITPNKDKIRDFLKSNTNNDFSNPEYWEKCLYTLKNNKPIYATQVMHLGNIHDLKIENQRGLINIIMKFFEETEEYRKKHSADYILIQDLRAENIDSIFKNSKLYGKSQLLIHNKSIQGII